jgi:hypothetical protein
MVVTMRAWSSPRAISPIRLGPDTTSTFGNSSRRSSMRCGCSDSMRSGPAVTVTSSSEMTGGDAGGSSPPAAEIDHIKTGKATRLDT